MGGSKEQSDDWIEARLGAVAHQDASHDGGRAATKAEDMRAAHRASLEAFGFRVEE